MPLVWYPLVLQWASCLCWVCLGPKQGVEDDPGGWVLAVYCQHLAGHGVAGAESSALSERWEVGAYAGGDTRWLSQS